MSKKWSHTEAFGYFGTKPRNVQWSWSARTPDGQTVVVTLWQDQFKCRDGRFVYEGRFDPGEPDKRLGFRELIENLLWARDHCDGRFRVIVAKAKDASSHPRSIEECFPHKRIIMRLKQFDPDTGNFTAEAEGG